jgi:adenylate cyclase
MTTFSVPLSELEECFQGIIPSGIGTVALDGTPNVTSLSIVHRVGDTHVALSRQFFNKTRANLATNPRAQLILVEPGTGRQFKLDLLHERTETAGAVFEAMRTRLDVVASLSGMSKVFKLAAVDICLVLRCALVASDWSPRGSARTAVGLEVLDAFSAHVAHASDPDNLVTMSLRALAHFFGYTHAIFLLASETGGGLYAVGSHGYESSGAGADVRLGEGVIGIAAQRLQPIHLASVARELAYARAVRSGIERQGDGSALEKEIPLPGLEGAHSQIAVPLLVGAQLLGVLFLESETPGRFTANDEAVLNVAARQISLSLALLRSRSLAKPAITADVGRPPASDRQTIIKHYAEDDSVFVDDDYLIKGVAGAIFWRLLSAYVSERRTDFSNREIRLDPNLDLPGLRDNVESRLVLLRRRLEDRCDFLRLHSLGRGRFRLIVERDIALLDVPN